MLADGRPRLLTLTDANVESSEAQLLLPLPAV
jgi:hypothetical protein